MTRDSSDRRRPEQSARADPRSPDCEDQDQGDRDRIASHCHSNESQRGFLSCSDLSVAPFPFAIPAQVPLLMMSQRVLIFEIRPISMILDPILLDPTISYKEIEYLVALDPISLTWDPTMSHSMRLTSDPASLDLISPKPDPALLDPISNITDPTLLDPISVVSGSPLIDLTSLTLDPT